MELTNEEKIGKLREAQEKLLGSIELLEEERILSEEKRVDSVEQWEYR